MQADAGLEDLKSLFEMADLPDAGEGIRAVYTADSHILNTKAGVAGAGSLTMLAGAFTVAATQGPTLPTLVASGGLAGFAVVTCCAAFWYFSRASRKVRTMRAVLRGLGLLQHARQLRGAGGG